MPWPRRMLVPFARRCWHPQSCVFPVGAVGAQSHDFAPGSPLLGLAAVWGQCRGFVLESTSTLLCFEVWGQLQTPLGHEIGNGRGFLFLSERGIGGFECTGFKETAFQI